MNSPFSQWLHHIVSLSSVRSLTASAVDEYALEIQHAMILDLDSRDGICIETYLYQIYSRIESKDIREAEFSQCLQFVSWQRVYTRDVSYGQLV
jgi:hypothetical protein